MRDYIKLRIDFNPCSEDFTDLMAALLADVNFESFEPDEKGLSSYVPKDLYSKDVIEEIINNFPVDVKLSYNEEIIPGKDWNEEWEKNYFKPIVIDDKVVVKSSFHVNAPQARYEILIDPKMAFGTGHHSTTSSMIHLILQENLNGKDVIDMGTGTGILGFLCKMKGAENVVGVEIDHFASENAIENASLNNLDVKIITGDAESLKNLMPADLLMANINRNIILNDLFKYSRKLKEDGIMLLSGFYKEDIPIIEAEANKCGLKICDTTETNNWVAIKLNKHDF